MIAYIILKLHILQVRVEIGMNQFVGWLELFLLSTKEEAINL